VPSYLHHIGPRLSCYSVHNIYSSGMALYHTLGCFQYPPTGTVRSGPSVPPGLSLQGRYFVNVEIVRRGLLDQAFFCQCLDNIVTKWNLSFDIELKDFVVELLFLLLEILNLGLDLINLLLANHSC